MIYLQRGCGCFLGMSGERGGIGLNPCGCPHLQYANGRLTVTLLPRDLLNF